MPIAADPIVSRSPLADGFPDIVARFDHELRHVYVNRRAEEVTGRPAGDFIGRSSCSMCR